MFSPLLQRARLLDRSDLGGVDVDGKIERIGGHRWNQENSGIISTPACLSSRGLTEDLLGLPPCISLQVQEAKMVLEGGLD